MLTWNYIFLHMSSHIHHHRELQDTHFWAMDSPSSFHLWLFNTKLIHFKPYDFIISSVHLCVGFICGLWAPLGFSSISRFINLLSVHRTKQPAHFCFAALCTIYPALLFNILSILFCFCPSSLCPTLFSPYLMLYFCD